MPFLPASRTKRNLIKVASLGLAGLLAGLLSGCTDSLNTSPAAASTTSYTHVPSESFNPDAPDPTIEAQLTNLPKSLDQTQIPALHHPPSSRSLQYGSVRTVSMAAAPGDSYGY